MDDWKEAVQRREPNSLTNTELTDSAVILPIYKDEGEGVLFTRRTDNLPRHAGQVSFPGGRMEKDDESLLDTALREIHEEVGLPPERVDIVGRLDDIDTTTGYSIRPFVGEVPSDYPYRVQEEEVDTLIFAPVDELTRPSIHETRTHEGYRVHYFHYDEYTIWGATAGILVQFLEVAYSWSP